MFNFFSAETLQAVQDWIIVNPNWAGLAVMVLSAAESLAVVGLFIPGLIVMGIVGALVAAGILNLVPTLLYAICGAIIGDGISYYLGFVFKDHLPNYWPFRRYPQWLSRGKSFFIHYGTMSIVIGRFVGPVRPFIPVVAGMMHMSPRVFFVANVISAVLWAPIYILPGIGITEIFF